MSLGRSGPGVRSGFLETPRTRFGGVLLASARTASQFAVSRHARVASGAAQRLWMSIAGRSSGEAWKNARLSWTCTNSPQSVGGPRAGDTGGGSSGSPRSVRLFWRLGRNSNGGNVSEPGSRHPSPPCAHVLKAQRAHHAAGQFARSAPVWVAPLGPASSLRFFLLAALTGLSCGHNGTPDSRSRCRD